MNVFYLNEIPAICAMEHCDKHVVKMILEYTQLMCTAHHLHPTEYEPIYRKTHINHPSAKWVRANKANYEWLGKMALCLCLEYTHRYDKRHKCQDYLEELVLHYPDIPDGEFYPPPQCMPDEYKTEDTIEAYRNYYKFGKRNIAKWKYTTTPEWF